MQKILLIMIRTLAALSLLVFFGLVGAQVDMKKDYAEYDVHLGVMRGYDATANRNSNLLDKQGNPFFYFNQYFNNAEEAWRPLGQGARIVSSDKWEIPNQLDMMWYSEQEDQFYQGRFDLPYEEIKKSFAEKVINVLAIDHRTKRVRRYKTLLIFIAPKGWIYVYLDGYAETKLVGRFQGKKIDYDWRQWQIDRSITAKKTEALKAGKDYYIGNTGIRFEIPTKAQELAKNKRFNDENKNYQQAVQNFNNMYNEGFFTPVNWHLKVKGQVDRLLYTEVDMINGERTAVYSHQDILKAHFHSIPKAIIIGFSYQGKAKEYDISLDNFRWNHHYLYQRYIKNFDMNKEVEVEIDLISAQEVSLKFRQGNKEIEIEDGSISDISPEED